MFNKMRNIPSKYKKKKKTKKEIKKKIKKKKQKKKKKKKNPKRKLLQKLKKQNPSKTHSVSTHQEARWSSCLPDWNLHCRRDPRDQGGSEGQFMEENCCCKWGLPLT